MTPLHEVCLASLPREALPVLAALRAVAGITVTEVEGRAWVRWPAGDEEVLHRLLPVAGVELFVQREGLWYRFGRHLPAFGVPPQGERVSLERVLLPAPVEPLAPPTAPLQPVTLWLAPDHRPRRAAAIECAVTELAEWADTVSSPRLASIRAASSGGRVLLLGEGLPLLRSESRYWGERVLVPLGWRIEPELPASAVRAALGVGEEELALLRAPDESASGGCEPPGFPTSLGQDRGVHTPRSPVPEPGMEVIPLAVFEPLTRARLRLALREAGS